MCPFDHSIFNKYKWKEKAKTPSHSTKTIDSNKTVTIIKQNNSWNIKTIGSQATIEAIRQLLVQIGYKITYCYLPTFDLDLCPTQCDLLISQFLVDKNEKKRQKLQNI